MQVNLDDPAARITQQLASIELNDKKEVSKKSIDRVTQLFLSTGAISCGMKHFLEKAKRRVDPKVLSVTAFFFATQTCQQLKEYNTTLREMNETFGVVELELHLNQVIKSTVYFSKKTEGKIAYYFIIKMINSGTFNNVYQCIKLPKGKVRALRLLRYGNELDFKREMGIHNALQQCASLTDNIVRKYETINSNKYRGSILSFYPFNLQKLMPNLKSYQKKDLLVDIFKTISNFHQEGFIHGDLKPENIMVEEQKTAGVLQLRAKICDFGSTFNLREITDHGDCTYYYKAPELFSQTSKEKEDIISKGDEYGFENDCWSLGIIAFEFKFGKLPDFTQAITGATLGEEFTSLIFEEVSQLSQRSDPYNQMLAQLFNLDRKNRLTAEQGLLLLESMPVEAFEVKG